MNVLHFSIINVSKLMLSENGLEQLPCSEILGSHVCSSAVQFQLYSTISLSSDLRAFWS